MVIYHLLYDLEIIFNKNIGFFSIESWFPIQQAICWSFIFISGFSVNLTKNPLKNSVKVLIGAYLLSLVTWIFVPHIIIKFGVLHLIGFSMAIVSFFKNISKKYSLPMAGLSFIIFFFIWNKGVDIFPFSKALRAYNIYSLGFFGVEFSSSDYFPLLPWFFLFSCGFFVGKYFENRKEALYSININGGLINKIGRYSFEIYLAHQVVLMGVLYALSYFNIL